MSVRMYLLVAMMLVGGSFVVWSGMTELSSHDMSDVGLTIYCCTKMVAGSMFVATGLLCLVLIGLADEKK